MQTRINDRLDSKQERYERDYHSKDFFIPTFKSVQTDCIGEPPLGAFSAHSSKRLAKTSYNKFKSKVMGPFAIVSLHPNTLTIDEYSIHIKASIDRTTLAPGNDSQLMLRNAYQTMKSLRQISMQTREIHEQNPLNTSSTKTCHRKASKMPSAIEISGTGIQNSMTLWNPWKFYRNTSYISIEREIHTAVYGVHCCVFSFGAMYEAL